MPAILGPPPDNRTRRRRMHPPGNGSLSSILEHGPSTAAELAERLGLTAAAIRRHLDVLLERGLLISREQRVYGSRGRGRPAKVFVLSDAGRADFYSAYDALAIQALEFLADEAGPEAVTKFAASRVGLVEARYGQSLAAADPSLTPAQALATALTTMDMSPRYNRRLSVSNCASTIAPWHMSPRSFRSSARSRPSCSPGCSACTFSDWPPSPTVTVSAPRTYRMP